MQGLLRVSLGVALLRTAWAGAALAALPVDHHVGSWDAFSGTGDDGKLVCGIGTTNTVDGRSFSIRFVIGEQNVAFEAKKPSWNIPKGTQLPLVMQIGFDAPWSEQGSGDGQTVTWTVDQASIQTFDAQFRRANAMTLIFPSGNEPPWPISLTGSTAASSAFGLCINEMTRRAGLQSPPAAAGPTEPFGQAPTQPMPPSATQPTPPAATQPTTPPAATQPTAPPAASH